MNRWKVIFKGFTFSYTAGVYKSKKMATTMAKRFNDDRRNGHDYNKEFWPLFLVMEEVTANEKL